MADQPLHFSSMRIALAALKNDRAHMRAWQGELGDSIHNVVMRDNAQAIASLEYHLAEIDKAAAGVEASQPLAYYDPIRDRVVTAAQMDSMLNHQGAPGKTAAKDYTVPLHASGVAARENVSPPGSNSKQEPL